MNARLPWHDGLLPDEILYSYAARLRGLNSLRDPRRTLERFFGSRKMIPSVDLPTHLDAAFEGIGLPESFKTVADLINRATLFPYYRFFMERDRWDRVFAIARGNDGKGLKTLVGLVASGLGASTVLRSCSNCNRESWARDGAVYWHRAHQLPFVSVCHVHGTTLTDHFKQSAASNRHDLVLPPVPPSESMSALASRRSRRDESLLRIARISRDVLESDASLAPSASERTAAYRAALRRRGWIRGTSQVLWGELHDAMREHLREHPTPGGAAAVIARRDGFSWMRSTMSPRGRAIHPILHVLMIEVLFESFGDFLVACRTSRETRAPAPCAPEANATTEVEILLDSSVSCRQAAKLLALSVTTVVKRRRALGVQIAERRKTITQRIRSLTVRGLASGDAIPKVAAQSQLSVCSVYRILAESQETKKIRGERLDRLRRDRSRALWTRTAARLGHAGTKQVRAAVPACYAWLYRNDRQWLCLHLPQRRARSQQLRVDWQKRDAALAAEVTHVAKRLRTTCSTPVTSTRLVAAVYDPTAARSNAGRLPRFWRAVNNEVVEQRGRVRVGRKRTNVRRVG